MSTLSQQLVVRSLGLCDYLPIWQRMQTWTSARTPSTKDELWCLQHLPVYTLGQAGKAEHILNAGNIPVVNIDRGGQVTYHGPGQLVVYTLIDLQRRGLGVRDFVTAIEETVIAILADYNVSARRERQAPGVYVGKAKIAAVGLRVRHGRTFHGVSINVDMNLAAFSGINPCGYAGMAVTQMKDVCNESSPSRVQEAFIAHFAQQLGYTHLSSFVE